MKKVLIADDNEDFRQVLSEKLGTSWDVYQTSDGEDACHMLQEDRPDFLVTDLMLRNLDGISLIAESKQIHPDLHVLVITSYVSPYVLAKLQELQVSYVMMKPCTVKAVEERLADLSTGSVLSSDKKSDVNGSASHLLMNLGFSTKLLGYHYLCECLAIMQDCPGMAITKQLYPMVAAKNHATASQVERAIRNAIECAWKHRNASLWMDYFGRTVDARRPTNSSLITSLSEQICYEGDLAKKCI